MGYGCRKTVALALKPIYTAMDTGPQLDAVAPTHARTTWPVGEYSPDWAIVYNDNGTDRLYLVRETKGTLNLDDLHWDEAMRIRFARRHFEGSSQLRV